MISLRHLLIFQAASETGSFTKAAQKLYITQSAVSHTIKELEEYTGLTLFDRFSKHVCPTPQGKLLLSEVSPLLSDWKGLEQRIRHLEKSAPLHIVSSITIASFFLPAVLQKMKLHFPETPVSVDVVSAASAIQILKSAEADIALVEGVAPQGPFQSIRFSDYTMMAVCAPEYPVPSDTLTLSDFCASSLLLREPGSAIRDTLDSQLYLAGHTIHPAWVSVNSTALLEAAKSGLGITVLPEVLVKEELEKGTLHELHVQGLTLKNGMFAVYHKNKHLTASMQELISYF